MIAVMDVREELFDIDSNATHPNESIEITRRVSVDIHLEWTNQVRHKHV